MGYTNFTIALLISAGVALLIVPGTTRAEELLLQSAPKEYKVAFETRKGNLRHVEMIPRAESLKGWSEMLTTQIFFGGVPQGSPVRFYEWVAERWKASCPSATAQLIRHGTEKGYPFAFWMLTCESLPLTSKPEHTWFKAIRGRDSFYLVQKAWRREPGKEEIVTWTRYLRSVAVCDTRAGGEKACPSGVSSGR
jgi:hypothetical protein